MVLKRTRDSYISGSEQGTLLWVRATALFEGVICCTISDKKNVFLVRISAGINSLVHLCVLDLPILLILQFKWSV